MALKYCIRGMDSTTVRNLAHFFAATGSSVAWIQAVYGASQRSLIFCFAGRYRFGKLVYEPIMARSEGNRTITGSPNLNVALKRPDFCPPVRMICLPFPYEEVCLHWLRLKPEVDIEIDAARVSVTFFEFTLSLH